MLYSELLEVDKSKVVDKASEWVNRIHSQNRSKTNPTMITGEYAHWFLKNILAEEFFLETHLGSHTNENMLVLCHYYISYMVDGNLLKK